MRSTRNTAAAATALVAAAALLSVLAPASAEEPADTSAPTGAVTGARNPASGTLELRLYANDPGSGLARAEALVDGDRASSADLSGPSVKAVPLQLDTTAVPDGVHRLAVEVTDIAGNSASLLDREILVENSAPATGPVASVKIGVTNKAPNSSGGGGKGGGKGKGPPCNRPKLRMHLATRPLWRTRPGKLPVLRFRKRHLYRGRLICQAGGKRALAPDGAKVDIIYRIWQRSFRKRRGPIRVRKGAIRVRHGRLGVRLGFLSGRTIVFRYRSPRGEVARKKLRIAIARTDPPRRGQ